jgi:predicted negative regulator of RcsB-dependent stress response
MHAKLTKTAILAILFVSASACAGGSDAYPSLAMRPFETGAAAQAPAPAPLPIRPATPPARIAELRAAAAAADSAFTARTDEAARLARAAAGQPFESSARAAAIIALAELDTQRGKTAGALAALDSLAAEAAGALSPDPAVAQAQGDIAATLARQNESIARLWGTMGS